MFCHLRDPGSKNKIQSGHRISSQHYASREIEAIKNKTQHRENIHQRPSRMLSMYPDLPKPKSRIFHCRNSTRPCVKFSSLSRSGYNQNHSQCRHLSNNLSHKKKVFSGLGCFSKPYHIKVDKTTPPTVVPPRNIPAALRDRT